MDRILVPSTGQSSWTRDVARSAIETESGTETMAIVLHVFEPEEIETTRANLDLETNEEYSLDELAARKRDVSVTADTLEAAGIPTQVCGRRSDGDPAETIVSTAEDEDVDRIYLYSRKRSPAGKAVFGSVLQRVLLNASCPVVVSPPNDTDSRAVESGETTGFGEK
ncbi:universal stress protein [Natronolimnohabitans sp. A-GB9]|uniref:universal stress protein n=1 Tax=Natronolimnohabitans sp. A-GB9 TaxID=3069757 RepID=UPI0027B0CA02|nr:universal stress protein [Natronolimnohabitans sp. A-GB9]MDQ2052233.1 universal stress protein [Natronolimnohabitans sp. A-GB9]